MVYRVNPGSRNPGAAVHAAAVTQTYKPAGSDAQAGAVRPEIESDVRGEPGHRWAGWNRM